MVNVIAYVLLVVALFCSPCALAETRVYLLRGWFGVFSTGIDKMAEDLRAKGIKAEPIGHLEWKAAAEKIAGDRASGASGPLVLVGHSQGGNNVVDMNQLAKGYTDEQIEALGGWFAAQKPAK